VAEEALCFARVAQKDYYDQRHDPIDLEPGDYAALVLHNGYKMKGNLPDHFSYLDRKAHEVNECPSTSESS
jgi:hypothetical protein